MLAPIGPLLSRRWVGLVVGVCAILAQLLHLVLPTGLLIVLVLTVALLPDGRSRGPQLKDLLAWYPLAAAVLLGLVSVVSVITGMLGFAMWSDAAAPWTLAGFTVVVTVSTFMRRGRVRTASPLSLIAWLPAYIVVAVQAFRFTQPMAYWSRPAWIGTDWVNHAELVQDLRNQGLLDYVLPTSQSIDVPHPYPRALHALLTWLLQGTSSASTAFDQWSEAMAALMVVCAVLTALAMVASGLLAGLAAIRLHVPTPAAITCVLIAGVTFMFPNWYAAMNWSGFVTTAAAVLVLPGFVIIAAQGRRDGGLAFRLVLLLLLTAAAFNTWQLLAVPLVVVDAWLLMKWWMRGRSHLVWVALAIVASVSACVTLGVTTMSTAGLQAALVPGPFSTFSMWFTLATTLGACIALLVGRPRRLNDPLVGPFVVIVLLLLAMGLALLVFTKGTVSDIPYYPAKVLWHAALLAYPVFVVAVAWTWWRIWTSRRLARLTHERDLYRVIVIGVPTVLLVSYFGGTLTINSPYRILHVTGAGGDRPQVPMAVLLDGVSLGDNGSPVLAFTLDPGGWHVESPFADWQASQIARSLGHPIAPAHALLRHRADEVCDWLRHNPTASRITGPARGQDELLAAGCPADVVQPDAWQVITTPEEWWKGIPGTNSTGLAAPAARNA